MQTDNQDPRNLIIYSDYKDGKHGFAICRVGKRAFIPDEVLAALAFGDEEIADTIAFKRLTEDFQRLLDELTRTESWDKQKQQRLKETLHNLFARGCASWFKIGAETRRK